MPVSQVICQVLSCWYRMGYRQVRCKTPILMNLLNHKASLYAAYPTYRSEQFSRKGIQRDDSFFIWQHLHAIVSNTCLEDLYCVAKDKNKQRRP